MSLKCQEKEKLKAFCETDSLNRNMDATSTDTSCPENLDSLKPHSSLDNSDASDKENSMDSASVLDSSFKSRSLSNNLVQDNNPDKSIVTNQEHGQSDTAIMLGSANSSEPSLDMVPLEEETPLFVTCGPNKAVLYIERLDKGSKGASILFDNWWLTPNEFQKVSGRGTAKDWKRSIKHHGRSLKLLMAKNMLFLNPPQCKCEYCVSDANSEGGDNGVKTEGEAANLGGELKAMTSGETKVALETSMNLGSLMQASMQSQVPHVLSQGFLMLVFPRDNNTKPVRKDNLLREIKCFPGDYVKGKGRDISIHISGIILYAFKHNDHEDSCTELVDEILKCVLGQKKEKGKTILLLYKQICKPDFQVHINLARSQCNNVEDILVPTKYKQHFSETDWTYIEFFENYFHKLYPGYDGCTGKDSVQKRWEFYNSIKSYGFKHFVEAPKEKIKARENCQDVTTDKVGPQGSSSLQEVDNDGTDNITNGGDDSPITQPPGERTTKPLTDSCQTRGPGNENQTTGPSTEFTVQVPGPVNGTKASNEAFGAPSQNADDFLQNGAKMGGNHPRQEDINHSLEINAASSGEAKSNPISSLLTTGNDASSRHNNKKSSRKTKSKPVHIITAERQDTLSASFAADEVVVNTEPFVSGVQHQLLKMATGSEYEIDEKKSNCEMNSQDLALVKKLEGDIECQLEMESNKALVNPEEMSLPRQIAEVDKKVLVSEERVDKDSNTEGTVHICTENNEEISSSILIPAVKIGHPSTHQNLISSEQRKTGEERHSSSAEELLAEGYSGASEACSTNSLCKSPQAIKTPSIVSQVHISPPFHRPSSITAQTSHSVGGIPAKQPAPLVTAPSNTNRRGSVEIAPCAKENEEGVESQENANMSPKKEARLINIIEELKHYKKCLEVQIQEQKKSSPSPPSVTKSSTPEIQHPQCPSVPSSSISPTSLASVSSPKPMAIPTPNTSALGSIPTPFSTALISSSGGCRVSSTFAGRSPSSPRPSETQVSDPTCHATGTVHWGMPKGHSPSRSSPSNTVIMPTQHHNNKASGNGYILNGGHSLGLSRTPPQGLKTDKNGHKPNGIYSTANDLLHTGHSVNALKTPSARSSSVPSLHSRNFITNNNNNSSPVPQVDMNAYFSYLSECLKRGQAPNMFGFCNNGKTPTKSSSAENSPRSLEKRGISPRNMPQKRTQSYETHLDTDGVLDLSVKRARISDDAVGYATQSSEPITLDECGALDLSKK